MNIEIANRLVELRKKAGLSQEDLANQLGISRQSVSKWERAEASPDTDNLICLARIYKVSLDDILKTEETVEEIAESAKKRSDAEEIQIKTKDNNTVIINSKGTFKMSAEESRKHDIKRWFQRFPFPVLVVCVYLLLGFLLDAWHPAWVIFFSIPLYYSLIESIYKGKVKDFAWPVLCAAAYLVMGFFFNLWHPGWIIFITIPIFYAIFTPIHKKKSKVTVNINGEERVIDEDDFDETIEKDVKDAMKDIKESLKDFKTMHININGEDVVIDADQDEDDIEDDIKEHVENAARKNKKVEINIGGKKIVINANDQEEEDDDE